MRRPLRHLPPEVSVLAAVAFAVALGFGILAPAIPLFAKEFGVSNTAAGAVVSVFALMRFVSAPLAGRLVDRLGERLVLASGIGIVGVSSLLAGLSGSYVQLLVLRGAGGVGSAMFTVSAFSLLMRVVRPDQRGQASGAFQAGFLVGGIAGPAFGGPLTAWSLRAPFFVYAATLLVAGTVGAVFLARSELREREREQEQGAGAAPTPLRTALRHPAYRAALVSNFANGWAVFGIRASLVPLFVGLGLGLGAEWTGYGLLVSAVVQALVLWPAGRLADTHGRRPFLRGGAALATAAGLVLAVSTSGPAFLVAMALFGAGSALMGVSTAAVVGDVIGGRGGSAVATYQMAADAGTFAGPLLAGLLSDALSFEAAFLSTAAVSAVALVAALAMPETRPTPPPASRVP
ncbi:MAG: MFS transporter [Actinomycetia bacterium]|jgi:MFS family permease|nr:MFS transporter [Actinomycetes bacterium]